MITVSWIAPEMKWQVKSDISFIFTHAKEGHPCFFPLWLTYVVPLKQGKQFSTSPIMSIFYYFHISVQYLIYLKALQL